VLPFVPLLLAPPFSPPYSMAAKALSHWINENATSLAPFNFLASRENQNSKLEPPLRLHN